MFELYCCFTIIYVPLLAIIDSCVSIKRFTHTHVKYTDIKQLYGQTQPASTCPYGSGVSAAALCCCCILHTQLVNSSSDDAPGRTAPVYLIYIICVTTAAVAAWYRIIIIRPKLNKRRIFKKKGDLQINLIYVQIWCPEMGGGLVDSRVSRTRSPVPSSSPLSAHLLARPAT